MDFAVPTDDFVRTIDVHELLPQQEPFVMIGNLTHFDVVTTRSSLKIPNTNIFVEDGRFTATGLIENIAQTCAARIGYINKYINKRGIQLGFIGAIRNLEIHDLPSVGDEIFTEVNVEEEVFGMILANAKVMLGDQALVTTEIKIAVKDEGTEDK